MTTLPDTETSDEVYKRVSKVPKPPAVPVPPEKLPKYPIYVPSKGRADRCLTANFLLRDGVPFLLVVEPQEVEIYAAHYGRERLLVLPLSNQGLTYARNWILDHARTTGAKRHWQLDDNMMGVWRRWRARKIRCTAGIGLRIVEDFCDRYENVQIAGMNYYMFAPNKLKCPPFVLNVHVYSCTLVDNSMPYRWRGLNEDVDICLQVLAGGQCTVLFNAFLIWKMKTMTMKGGQMMEAYKGDGRLKMAKFLEREWPGVVTTERRFQRPQHVVKNAWRNFDTPLIRRKDIDWENLPAVDEFGMALHRVKETKSPELQNLINEKDVPKAKRKHK